MTTVGYVFVGGFALVFCVFPAALLLADRYSDKAHRAIHCKLTEWKVELASRWMAAEGLTVIPMNEYVPEPEAVHTASVDDLLRIINEV